MKILPFNSVKVGAASHSTLGDKPHSAIKGVHPRIVGAVDRHGLWQAVDDFFWEGFGFRLEFTETADAFRTAVTEGRRVDILILPSSQERLRLLDAEISDLQEALETVWCVLDATESTPDWKVPRIFGRIAAIFTQSETSTSVVPRFASLVFERWLDVQANEAFTSTTRVGNLNREEAVASARRSGVIGGSHYSANLVRGIIDARQNVLGPLGTEPVLSILLELYHSHISNQTIDITSLGAQLRLPMSTLTRKLDYLADKKVVSREEDEDDRRRCHVRLTPIGIAIIAKYLAEIKGSIT